MHVLRLGRQSGELRLLARLFLDLSHLLSWVGGWVGGWVKPYAYSSAFEPPRPPLSSSHPPTHLPAVVEEKEEQSPYPG